jgi:hypothetical protein
MNPYYRVYSNESTAAEHSPTAMSDTPRTDAAIKASKGQWGHLLRDLAQEMERELAAVADAIHKIHPTRRGSLVDMVEDLESHRETAMNAFRLSEKELAAERELADRLGNAIKRLEAWIGDSSPLGQALAAWKEARNA